jgi:DNA-binding transcriptional regulator YhcF (GntR family)
LTLGNVPRGPGRSPETTQLPINGVERYRFFYSRLEGILQDYREGKLEREEATEAIASVCSGKNTYQLFHVVDVWEGGKPIDRRVFRSDRTLKRLLGEAIRYGWALLYRGMFFIPKEVWREYRENYSVANRFEVFKLERLTQTASHILIDIDKGTFEDLKRVVKYLQKLGIYPEVWESASGEGNYHIYIRLVGHVWKRKEEKENGEEVEHRWAYLPYASDYRLKIVIEALKEIFRRLGVSYDSISATRAVWMEGIPNPEKGGKASKKIWEGKVHRIDKIYEKLKPIWEGIQRRKTAEQFWAEIQPRKRVEVRGTYEVVSEEHSNVIDYLQDNISTAFRMIDRGYTRMEAEAELRAGWTGDEKQFERAFPKFWDWVEATHKPLEVKLKKGAKPKEKRKHKHFWEHIDAIHEALKDGYTGVREIARKAGIPKSTVSKIFQLISREQILKDPEEAKAYLLSIQKGGDRMTKEQKEEARKRGEERFRRYMEKVFREAEKSQKKSLSDKPQKRIYGESLGYFTLKGVQIGSISIFLSPKERDKEGGGWDFGVLERRQYSEVLSASVCSPKEGKSQPLAHEVASLVRQIPRWGELSEEERRRVRRLLLVAVRSARPQYRRTRDLFGVKTERVRGPRRMCLRLPSLPSVVREAVARIVLALGHTVLGAE